MTADLRKRVANWGHARRVTVDEPWGTSLTTILARDAPDLLAMLVDEDLDPRGYHSGSARYTAAWARLDQIDAEEIAQAEALIAADVARQKAERKFLWSDAPDAPLEPPEEPDLLPLPRS